MAPVVAPGDYAADVASLGFQWGQRDCLLWLADWARLHTGRDGGSRWRGRYKTALGCTRVLNRDGGMLACIREGAEVAGMVETTSPGVGAVGLIKSPSLTCGEIGGIFTGTRWLVLSHRGVLSVRGDAVAAWDLP